jgi:hypothetical protein
LRLDVGSFDSAVVELRTREREGYMLRMVGRALLVVASLAVGFIPSESLAQKPGKPDKAATPEKADKAAKPSAAEEELLQIEREGCPANLKKDIAYFERVVADDYTDVNSRGVGGTKAELIAGLKSGDVGLSVCVDENVKVRVYGDAAVVTGLGTRTGKIGAGSEPVKERKVLWVDFFVKKDGRWQVVASQLTQAAPQK